MAVELVFQHGQLMDALLCGLLLVADVVVNAMVVDDGARLDGSSQLQSFKGSASAQGHVDLTRGKRHVGVDDGVVEGKSLTLVYGDGPRQSQGQLREGSQHVGFQFATHGVKRVLGILPHLWFHFDVGGIALASDQHLVAVEGRYASDASVVVTLSARCIVLDEHHLSAHLQYHRLGRRIGVVGEGALQRRPEGVWGRLELVQLMLVDPVGSIVVGAQADGRDVSQVLAERCHAAVEHLQVGGSRVALPNVVKKFDEACVLLSVDGFQLNGHVVGCGKCLAAKEIRRVVVGPQQLFVLGSDDGRQLSQVAYHEQLHAPKGLVAVAESAQHGVDGIEQIGTHHRNLVDDEQVHRGDDLAFFAAEVEATLHFRIGHEGRQGELKEGMDSHAPCVDGSYTRGCNDYRPLGALLHNAVQERRLARASLTRQEDAAPGMLDEVPCQLYFVIHW